SPLDRMGTMRLFDRAEPDGYPEVAAPWISAGTLAERARWVQALCIAPNASGHADAGASRSDPVALLKRKLPSSQWYDAGAVAEFGDPNPGRWLRGEPADVEYSEGSGD